MRPAIMGGGWLRAFCGSAATKEKGGVQVRLRWGQMWQRGGGLAVLAVEFVKTWAVIHCSWRAHKHQQALAFACLKLFFDDDFKLVCCLS